MNVAPFEENFNTGTHRFVFKAKESAIKETATFPLVKDYKISQQTLRTPFNF